MVQTCVDPVIDQLSDLELFGTSEFERMDKLSQYFGAADFEKTLKLIEGWKRELRFLQMILWCFETLDYSEGDQLRSLLINVEEIWNRSKNSTFLSRCFGVEIQFSKVGSQEEAAVLDREIQQAKLIIEQYCEGDLYPLASNSSWGTSKPSKRLVVCPYRGLEKPPLNRKFLLPKKSEGDLLYWSLKCGSLETVEILQFLNFILQNLKDLLSYKADEVVASLKEVEVFQNKLMLLHNFFKLAIHGCADCKEVEDFKSCVLHSFASRAACLVFLCWVKEATEVNITNLNLLLSDTLQEFMKPCVPDIWVLYFGALKAIKLQRSEDRHILGQTVSNVVDLLLQNQGPLSTNHWRILRDRLIFVLAFMADPPVVCAQDQQLTLIRDQMDAFLHQGLSLILLHDEIKQDSVKENVMLCDFATKIDTVKGTIRQLYAEISEPLLYTFPRINGMGFFDFLLQKLERLKDKLSNDTNFKPFAKNVILKIKEELLSLRPLVNGIFELQKEHLEFKDTWVQVTDLAYLTEHAINACSTLLRPIWYHMLCLFDILERIEAVKGKLDNVESYKIYDTEVSPHTMGSMSLTSERASYSMDSYEVIGFDEEAKSIIDELIGGPGSLEIISIVGMGGLGKTTLAKKVYNSSSVKSHFHEVASCSVSQSHTTERLLLEILSCIKGSNNDIKYMTKDDLAHKLWKSLTGKRYLIVLDDIWDIGAWDDVKGSLPKEHYGSRVIFTTRTHLVASEAKISAHNLRFLSAEESFELLGRKTFGKDGYPSNFVEVGKMVSKNCKGLPLAIVVVAGLLASDRTNLTWWKEIAETTSYFAEEGCRDIIGLSYKHLPESLKACFLYLSVYKEDESIEAKKIELLWIAEGFVSKSGNKSLRSVAKEYMRELVDRKYVIVRSKVISADKTLRGRTRTCLLHDLVRDFSRQQAQADNFIWLKDEYGIPSSSKSAICSPYRVCFMEREENPSDDLEQNVAANIHSLLDFRQGYYFKEWEIFRELKSVQVLYLKYLPEVIFSKEFPLFDLLHLRHIMGYSFSADPSSVARSICSLWNLETFIWEHSESERVKLPKTIWNMKRLRHLESFEWELDVGDDLQEGRRPQLDNIESISKLCLSDDRTAIEVLQRLPNIQKLDLQLRGKKWSDQVFAMDFLAKLESLTMSTNAQHVIFPTSLKRLKFYCNYSSTQVLSAIGELPCLEVLKIFGCWTQWVVEDNNFEKLKYLYLKVAHMEQWSASDNAFASLEQLKLRYCSYLKEIPACFGELPYLREIVVDTCNDKVKSSAIQIQEEQMDAGKILDLQFSFKPPLYIPRE